MASRFPIVALFFIFGCTFSVAQSARTAMVSQIAPDAVCRNAAGAKIAPAVRPAVPASADLGSDARARFTVDTVECFLNPSEFTIEGSQAGRCSSARIAGSQPRLAGTRGITPPHCDD